MWLHDTSLNVWEEHVDETGMYPILQEALNRLERRGFAVTQDPSTLKNYPSLARWHWVGKRQDLEFIASLCGRHLQLEFFQNVVSGGNRNGGRYDFGKFQLMPHRMRLQFIAEMTGSVRQLCELGYSFVECGHHVVPLVVSPLSVRDAATHALHNSPLARFNANWGATRFARDETGWPTAKELKSWPYPDRTGRPVRTGDTKYLRHKGRLQRCTVWPNMNGMWQACFGDQVRWVHTGELFECERPDLEPRRYVPGQLERLEKELSAEIAAKNYRRVAALGLALQRTAEAA
jgi:hypothetical protein